jgi:hypothetical protein
LRQTSRGADRSLKNSSGLLKFERSDGFQLGRCFERSYFRKDKQPITWGRWEIRFGTFNGKPYFEIGYSSIRKGIISALPIAKQVSIERLKSILRYWGMGRVGVGDDLEPVFYGMNNVRMFMMRNAALTIAGQLEKLS